MSNGFTIRPAEIIDAKKIFGFVCALEDKTFDYEKFYLDYRNNILANNNVYLVAADQENNAVGYISCHGQSLLHHGGMVYEIQELYVEDAWRKQGAGKTLLKALELQLAKRDYQSLEVTAKDKRKEAIELYRKYGFQNTHVKLTRGKK
ncbi:MAG TPA: GNAT family N-acetyltransferase [Puia sp.]|jgi:PhnO protein|nr:GNAT family N-acetyltransferase [Puia sp.]